MSGHTPGPWVAENGTQNGGRGWGCWDVFACDDVGTYVAGANRDNPDQEANARLIAAAPRMFALLERIRDDQSWRTNDNGIWPELIATIKDVYGAAE